MFRVIERKERKCPLDAKTQPVVLQNVLDPKSNHIKMDLKKPEVVWTQDEDEYLKLVQDEDSVNITEAVDPTTEEQYNQAEMSGTYHSVPDTLLTSDNRSYSVYHVVAGEQHIVCATSVPRDQWHLPHVRQAKQAEIKNLNDFNTYEEVEENLLNELQKNNVIRSLWVIVSKDLMGETVTKARLVCCGNEETVEFETASPTATRLSLRMCITTAASKNWKLKSLDFQGAFLQGKQVDREIIVIPPSDQLKRSERGNRMLWKLKKKLYGLKDAGRAFWQELDETLLSLGCVRSKHDKAVYLFKSESGELLGFLAVHVDDVAFAGEEVFHNQIITAILRKFVIGRVEEEMFTFTGWRLVQQVGKITLTQDAFVDKLRHKDIEMLNLPGQNKDAVLQEGAQKVFRSAVGALAWLSGITRPDLSRVQTELASQQGKATVHNRLAALRNSKFKSARLDLRTYRRRE